MTEPRIRTSETTMRHNTGMIIHFAKLKRLFSREKQKLVFSPFFKFIYDFSPPLRSLPLFEDCALREWPKNIVFVSETVRFFDLRNRLSRSSFLFRQRGFLRCSVALSFTLSCFPFPMKPPFSAVFLPYILFFVVLLPLKWVSI